VRVHPTSRPITAFVRLLVGVGLAALPMVVARAAKPALTASRGRLEPAYARAERSTRVVIDWLNEGDTLEQVSVTLQLPAGATTSQSVQHVASWDRGERREFSWEVVADRPLVGEARVEAAAGDRPAGQAVVPLRWHEPSAVQPLDAVPEPHPVDTGRAIVCAVHCPLWAGGRPWRHIVPHPDREPVLGWYDEGSPEVTDWEVTWALDHGISCFLVCWYRAKGNEGRPVEPALDHWLEGLRRSRHGDRMQFAIIFENGNRAFAGGTSEADLLDHLLPFWIDQYFRRPNYLQIDGRPVLAIYDVPRFVEDLGGEAATARILETLRDRCRAAGFAGLTILGQSCWGRPAGVDLTAQVAMIHRLGMDAHWAYHWPTFAGVLDGDLRPDAAKVMAAQEQLWRSLPQPSLITASMGWDSTPWKSSLTPTRWRLTPEDYAALCRSAARELEQRRDAGIAGRLVLLDNWNEFGEGHYLMPHREHGFDYLHAVRAAFAPGAPGKSDPEQCDPVPCDLVPEDIGLGPYDSAYRAWSRAAEDASAGGPMQRRPKAPQDTVEP